MYCRNNFKHQHEDYSMWHRSAQGTQPESLYTTLKDFKMKWNYILPLSLSWLIISVHSSLRQDCQKLDKHKKSFIRWIKQLGSCKVALSSTHHIVFAAISYPRMSKHSGGHTGEEQTAWGHHVQTVVTSGSCLSVASQHCLYPGGSMQVFTNWIPVATKISSPNGHSDSSR